MDHVTYLKQGTGGLSTYSLLETKIWKILSFPWEPKHYSNFIALKKISLIVNPFRPSLGQAKD